MAVVVGFANGWLVTRLKIPSFLVTLGMLLVVRGIALFVTDGFPSGRGLQTRSDECHCRRIFRRRSAYLWSLLWFILFTVILGYVLTERKPATGFRLRVETRTQRRRVACV